MLHRAGMWAVSWAIILLLVAPAQILAQQGAEGPPVFRQEELAQMLAPIALYPDDLLAQVLIAATYPLEIVQAARWARAYPNLGGDELTGALEAQDWDPSVKSLIAFPQVLTMLDEHLDWTQKLGDAFLAQRDEVMDTVQNLRARAQAQGTLQSTNEQRVIVEERIIRIEPPSPEVVYVPVYDPTIVYGSWWYPAYPPFYYYHHYPGYVVGRPVVFMGFGVGVAAWGYAWGGFHWARHDVVININRHVHINPRIDRHRYVNTIRVPESGRGAWVHSPAHRKGIAYRDPGMARKFGVQHPGAETRREFRGFDGRRDRPVIQTPERPPLVRQPRESRIEQPRVQNQRKPAGAGPRPDQPRPASPSSSAVTPPPRSIAPQPAPASPPPKTVGPASRAVAPAPAPVSPAPRAATPPPAAVAPPPRAITPQPSVAAAPPRASAAAPPRTVAAPPRPVASTAAAPVQQRREGGAFSGSDRGSAAKEFSNRGHQSVSSANAGAGPKQTSGQGGSPGKDNRRR